MTLDRLRPLVDRALEPCVGLSVRLGLTPNGISVLAFLLAAGAAVAFALGGRARWWYLAGALLVFGNGWLDLLDGAVARRLGVDSAAGDLLDHALDRYADILVIAGLAVGVRVELLGFAAVTGALMTSYMGTQAEAVGLDRVYGGLMGRADRLALVAVVSAVAAFVRPPAAAPVGLIEGLLVVFAVVGHATAVQRFYRAMRALA